MVFRRAHFRDKGEKREKATGNKYGSKNGRMICSAKVIICKKVLNFLQSLGSRSKEDKRVFGDDTFLLQRIQMSTVLNIKCLSYFKPKVNRGIIYPYVSVAFTFEFIGYNSFFILTFLWLNIQTNYKAYKCTYHIYVVSLSMPKRK